MIDLLTSIRCFVEIASKHDVSLADTIVVLVKTIAVEEAATAAGFDVDVPFISVDASKHDRREFI